MKIFGHPLHLMMIHFPSALLPMELVCSIIFYFTGDKLFAAAAFYALCGAVIVGWAAIITGFADLVKIPSNKAGTLKIALLHGCINATVIIAYTVIAYIAFKKYPYLPNENIVMLIFKVFLVGFMFVANYFGGSLILKHKIGVEENKILEK